LYICACQMYFIVARTRNPPLNQAPKGPWGLLLAITIQVLEGSFEVHSRHPKNNKNITFF
jgi:hypothetical protein